LSEHVFGARQKKAADSVSESAQTRVLRNAGPGFQIDKATRESLGSLIERESGRANPTASLSDEGFERQAEAMGESAEGSARRHEPGGHPFTRLDLTSVRIHADAQADSSARSMGAVAYTMGTHIFFEGGQYAPQTKEGRSLLAHELAHVIQQSKAGEASRVVQRKVSTLGGEWDTDRYDTLKDGGKDVGVDIDLKFVPKPPANSTKIGLVQKVNSREGGRPIAVSPTARSRSIPTGEADEGAHIDRRSEYGNPLYPTEKPSSTDTLASTPTTSFWGQHGWLYTDSAKKVQEQDARLKDKPELSSAGNDSGQVFETAALAVEGPQSGTTYGSVQWGWQRDGSGSFSKLPLAVVTTGIPSASFRHAADLWNKSKTSDSKDVLKLPDMRAAPAAPGTEAREIDSALWVNDFATAYQILNGQWMRPMLQTLATINSVLPKLYMNLDQAAGVSVPRLRAAIEAVQNKISHVPLSQEFHDWIDPSKNPLTSDINEIKAYLGI
jgi:hypothetical protein